MKLKNGSIIEHYKDSISEKSVPLKNNKLVNKIKADSFANR